jgi:hypothetical protein
VAGLFKTNDMSEQRAHEAVGPGAHAASRRTALRRSRDTGDSFGAMVCRTTKHLTCRRRLAVAAEVRARVPA